MTRAKRTQRIRFNGPDKFTL